MAVDEDSALDITAARALETADRSRALWTDADRAWASRAAAQTVGENAAAEAFLAQRARLVLERAAERSRVLPRAVCALGWRSWVGGVLVIAAFIAGMAIDRIGAEQQINVLAPPVLFVLAWNLVVYALIPAGYIVRYGEPSFGGSLRRFVARLASGLRWTRVGSEYREALAQLVMEWSRISAPLYSARAARILHFSAAALAAGVLVGLYWRGIALEYRATWESTFLDASSVHRILAIVLSPGAVVTGIPLPGVPEIEAIQAPGSENAARWLHLMAGTVASVVVVPRLLLAFFALMVERYRSTHLPVALDDPYFQRVLRDFRGAPARVRVVPYSYTPAPSAAAGLERLLARVFGNGVALTIAAPLTYGAEPMPAAALSESTRVIVLFNAAATPEADVHGAFLASLSSAAASADSPIALVDESVLRSRWAVDPTRFEDRRRAWREVCAERRTACAFVDLAASDAAEAEAVFERALAEAT